MKTTTRNRLSLAQIIEIEPRVGDLLHEARAAKSNCKNEAECSRAWMGTEEYRGLGIRASLDYVVGWKVENPLINTGEAYLTVQREVLDILGL